MKKLAALSLAALAACADLPTDAPAPEAAALEVAPVTLSLAAAGSLNFSSDLNAVHELTRGFTDASVSERAGGKLDALRASLAAGNHTEAAEILASLRSDLVPGVTNDGDLGYIELVLRDIGESLSQ